MGWYTERIGTLVSGATSAAVSRRFPFPLGAFSVPASIFAGWGRRGNVSL